MTRAFSDRRYQLFGREADMQFLSARAGTSGMTAVVARPLMGKTWTLTEVARRLTDGGQYLVSYHESTAAESSHLLYAVANLYSRWLADSSMRAQALSLWQRHKSELVPRIGQMVGTLFEKLAGKQLPEGVADIVRSAFDGLAIAQQDLLSGGMQIVPLPYDQALSLTKLVATVSGRRVVLILDAWEKSHSIRAESATLETFLKHRADWPHTHVFLAIRNPEVDSTQANEEAYQRARDLCKLSPAAQIYDLPPFNLTDAQERARAVSFVRNNVPATQQVDEHHLLQMIGDYPGVLYFWTDPAKCNDMHTKADLRQEAGNAQAGRYPEFDHLLKNLEGEQHTLAVRLAFFPRLDAETWNSFRPLLMQELSDAAINALIDSHVLSDDRVPTYGHDTRHAAARRWFITHKLPLIRRTAEALINSLAAGIEGMSPSKDAALFEALAACAEAAQQVGVSSAVRCLIDAALSTFNVVDGLFQPAFDDAYPVALQQSNGRFATLFAVALFNRGVIKWRRDDVYGEIADYTAVINLPGAPSEWVTKALYNRGITKGQRGDVYGAITDYTAAIELPGAPPEPVAKALYNRGITKKQIGDIDGAITDYTAAIELPGAPPEQVAKALCNRGIAKGLRDDDIDGKISDYTAAIELPGAPPEWVANALYCRGIIKGLRKDIDGEIADYTAAIDLPGAPPEVVAEALYNRGLAKGQRNDVDGKIADYTAAIELPGAPPEVIANARRRLSDLESSR